MRLKRFEVGGLNPPFPSTAMLSDYTYDADGSLRFASGGGTGTYDRAYQYDDFGRLKEAFTSQQARDYNLNGTVGGPGGESNPYRQSYQYDVWGNQTSRDNWYWERHDTHAAAFSNDRRVGAGWSYDSSGNLTASPDVALTYDAAGRNRTATSLGAATPKVITQWHGGDGQAIKRQEEGGGEATETVYYLRSTMLGGAVVAELDAQGVKAKGKVYLNGALIAEHGEQPPGGARWVEWKHEEPMTGRRGVSDSGANYLPDEAGELDAAGIAFGPPTLIFPAGGISDERGPAVRYGAGIPNGQCTLDGIGVDCADAGQLMGAGLVAEAPDEMVRGTAKT